APEGGVEHARQRHVVDETPVATKEPRVFSPLYRRAEVFRAHGSSSPRLYTRFPAAESCAILAATSPISQEASDGQTVDRSGDARARRTRRALGAGRIAG